MLHRVIDVTTLGLLLAAAASLILLARRLHSARPAPLAALCLVLAALAVLRLGDPRSDPVPARQSTDMAHLLVSILALLGARQLAAAFDEQAALYVAARDADAVRDRVLGDSQRWLEAVPLACVVTTAEGRITDWSPVARRVFGYTRAEALGRHAQVLLVSGEEQAEAGRVLGRLVHGGAQERSVHHGLRKDGRRMLCEWTHAPLRDEAGGLTGVLVLVRDVTEQRELEESASRVHERFAAVAEMTSDAIWDWNVATGRVWWGAGLGSAFGHEIQGESTDLDWWSARLHPDDSERVIASLRSAAESPDVETWSERYRFRLPDGGWASVLDRGRLLRDAQGRTVRVVGAMVDLSRGSAAGGGAQGGGS